MNLEVTYTLKELLKIVPLARSTIYDLMSQDKFPNPVKIGKRYVRWRKRDIVKWFKEQGLEEV